MASRFDDSGSAGVVIEAFEAALQRGGEPRIADYLPQPDDFDVLIELIHVEMEYQLKHGREASVSEFLRSYPQLASERAAIVELIEAEYRFRSRLDPSLTRASFQDRYPAFSVDPPASTGSGLISRPTLRFGDQLPDTDGFYEGKPGATIAGRYTLVDRIGEGGMGEVWVAKQIEPVKRNVALKLIKPGMDSRAVIQRFEQERQALALMDHPNIAKVLDGGLTEGRRPFFVMELVNGLPVTQFCDVTKIGIRTRLELFILICQAVQHAHQKGIVHRDLKPSNILVTMIDGKPIPKVIDFGLAKAIGGKLTDESILTNFGTVVGTLEYMSPEQAGFAGEDVDTRADIYSLGVVLYELLTGLRPFDGKRLRKAAFDEMIRMIREEEPSKPSTRMSMEESSPALAAVRQIEPAHLSKLLRGELDWLVMKCLEKQRDRRYETVDGLAHDVQRFLADEAVEARPPNAAYRWSKFVRRNKRSVIASSLVFLAILGGIAGTTWGLIRAERAKAQSDIDRKTAEIKGTTASQLTEYLVRTFQTADPVGMDTAGFHGPGEQTEEQTARRMLDRGTEIVHEYLGDQPLVRASLLDAMGNSYRNLGAWDTAQGRLKEAYDLRLARLGKDNADTLVSLQSLAHLARDRGDYVEADRLYRDVIAHREKLYTPNHLLVAETKTYLAWMTFHRPLGSDGPQFNQDNLADAEKLLLEVLKVREAQLPKNHRDIGYTLAGLSSIKLSQPKQELFALSYLNRASEVFRESDQDTLFGSALLELIDADRHRKAGRYDQAETTYLKVLALFRRHLGNQHPLVLIQMGNLAGLYRQKGDGVKAERTLQDVLQMVRPVPSLRTQPMIVNAMIQYADEIRQKRSTVEAEGLFREALQYARERPQGNEKNLEDLEKRLPSIESK